MDEKEEEEGLVGWLVWLVQHMSVEPRARLTRFLKVEIAGCYIMFALLLASPLGIMLCILASWAGTFVETRD